MATRRERKLQRAEKLIQRGRLESAIDELKAVLKESPDDTRTLNRVGDLYARLNRVDEAIDLFTQAAERFTKEGFFVKAIAIYKKILRLDPTRMPVYGSLAELYRHQGLTNEARAQYQVVADYYEDGEDSSAVISVYEKLVELDPADPEVRLRLAEHLAAADRTEDAVVEHRKAATTLLESGDGDAALEVLVRVLEIASDDLEFVIETVMQLQPQASPELVERFLAAAIERNPRAVKARELLASVFAAAPEAAPEPATPEKTPEPAPEPEAAAAEEAAELPAAPAEFEIELDAFEKKVRADREAAPPPEPVAPEPAGAAQASEVDEFLLEADALAGYGLEAKAAQRLERVLELSPGHLGAYRRLIAIQANARRDSEVVALATRAAAAALESGDAGGWREIVRDLTRRGFRIEGSKIVAPPAPVPEAPEELFVDLPEEAGTEPEAAADAATAAESGSETAVDTADQEEADWLGSLTEERGPERPPEEAGVAAQPDGAEPDFFDLGAELQQELGGDEEDRLIATPDLEGQTVEEIVEGFKKGMAEVLSPEAYDTHYSLGVAYREMGLVDEAIGEFQLAAKDPRYLVECCSLLGQCFQEKDFPDLAIKWYRKGLDSPYITEEENLGLLYEMGNLHLANGDRDAARKAFTEIYGSNSNFRDVVAKLAELRGDRG